MESQLPNHKLPARMRMQIGQPAGATPTARRRLALPAINPAPAASSFAVKMAQRDSEMAESAKQAKQKRYDRQLRLWGEHGQEAMEECSICLLNASATGSETLKNLVLPGIGSFTIVDGATVSSADLGNNFFLDSTCLGKPRARCVTEMLAELNEHVRGSYVEEDIGVVLASRPDFLDSFSLVVGTQLGLSELRQVSAICRARGTPLLLAHAYGLMGYLRLDLGEHEVVEAHPDHPFPDLRVLSPPPALTGLICSKYSDLAALSTAE